MGLDAEVVRRIEADPGGKRKWGEWAYVAKALRAAVTEYRGASADVHVEIDGETQDDLVFAVCANARPFTYFKRLPVDACPLARLDAGLDAFGLTKVRAVTIPRVAWSVLVSRSHPRWRSARYFHDVNAVRLTAARPLPVQVDGDYVGERMTAAIELVPNALNLLI